MNPALLKPSSDTGAQAITYGKVRADMNARDYHQYTTIAMQAVPASQARLGQRYDAIIVEGAGSRAKINLRERGIAIFQQCLLRSENKKAIIAGRDEPERDNGHENRSRYQILLCFIGHRFFLQFTAS